MTSEQAGRTPDADRSDRILGFLIGTHLVVLVFQIPLRAVVLDTTLFRDALLVLTLCFWIIRPRMRWQRRANPLDRAVAAYVGYGVVLLFVALFRGDALTNAILQFRNFFLPALLYFPARAGLAGPKGRAALVSVLAILCFVSTADVLLEYVASKAGVSRSILPWYEYMYGASYRFVGNATGMEGTVLPEFSPVLGFFGWPHYTAPVVAALFAMTYPFLSNRRFRAAWFHRKWTGLALRLFSRLAFLTTPLLAVALLGVRVHIVTMALVLLALPPLLKPSLLKRNAIIVGLCLAMFAAIGSFDRAYAAFMVGVRHSVTDKPSTLQALLSPNEWIYLLRRPSPAFLVGTGDIADPDFQRIGSFELRLSLFTAAYGLLWLILFTLVFAAAFLRAWRLIVSRRADWLTRLYAEGAAGVIVVYGLEMGHYGRLMYAPNFDIWIVCMAGLSALSRPRPVRRVTIAGAACGAGAGTSRGFGQGDGATDSHLNAG